MKITKARRCVAIITPGEFITSKWDYQQCAMTTCLIICEMCGDYYCLTTHWHKHNHDLEVMVP